MYKLEIVNPFNSFFNYQVFALIGIVLQIFGGLFLGLEAIGLHKLIKFIDAFRKFSKWYKKSLLRMTILIIPFFIIMTVATLLNMKTVIGLFFPTMLLLFGATSLIDHPDFYEKKVLNESKEKRIGPIGFLILVCGCIFQMISIIWQMALK